MSNRTYVCFDCRTTERVPGLTITKICRKCRRLAEHVFYKFKIPKRNDDRGWDSLRQKARAVNLEIQTRVLARLRSQEEKLQRVLAEMPVEKEAKRRDLNGKLRLMQKQKAEWLRW